MATPYIDEPTQGADPTGGAFLMTQPDYRGLVPIGPYGVMPSPFAESRWVGTGGGDGGGGGGVPAGLPKGTVPAASAAGVPFWKRFLGNKTAQDAIATVAGLLFGSQGPFGGKSGSDTFSALGPDMQALLAMARQRAQAQQGLFGATSAGAYDLLPRSAREGFARPTMPGG